MLRIQRVRRYNTAKYPRREYTARAPGPGSDLLKRGGVSLLLLAFLEGIGCEDNVVTNGTTGPPPIPGDMITENEARQIITRVFTDNGIGLIEDYRLAFQPDKPDSTILWVDGYNDSLRVGYEYITNPDYSTFGPARAALADSAEADGPYVKTINQLEDTPHKLEIFELYIETFIDTLKARGVI